MWEELQDTANSSEFNSKFETIETESVQERENNFEQELKQEIKQEKPNPSVKPKSKNNTQFNPKVSVKKIEKTRSQKPVPVKNFQHKNSKLGSIAIFSGDQKIIQLWSVYDE